MCLFGGSPSGGAKEPPPVPTLPSDPPQYADKAVTDARNDAQARAISMAGLSSTNFTSGLGVPNLASTTKTQLGA